MKYKLNKDEPQSDGLIETYWKIDRVEDDGSETRICGVHSGTVGAQFVHELNNGLILEDEVVREILQVHDLVNATPKAVESEYVPSF